MNNALFAEGVFLFVRLEKMVLQYVELRERAARKRFDSVHVVIPQCVIGG